MKKISLLFSLFVGICTFAQTYYSQDFEASGLNNWTNTDLNNDTYVWNKLNASSVNAAFGSGSIVSFSYIDATNSAVTPNNLITSPLIDLSAVTATSVTLTYDVASSTSWPAEQYSVYVSTTNNGATIAASTPIFNETLTGGYQNRSINLTPYIGQQIYVSFRHHDCFDKYYLVVDNVKVSTINSTDYSLTGVGLDKYGLINTNYTLKAAVKNNGSTPITSVTLNWNDGVSDHLATIPVASIPYGGESVVTHTIPVNYASLVEKNINVTITGVNSGVDTTPADNSASTSFHTVSQTSPKKVLIEEGTGTWCGYCPRGAVAMEYMYNNFPNDFIGIAVHNGDPMVVAEYNTGAAFSGYPSMNVDRAILDDGVSQLNMSNAVNQRKNLIVPAQLTASGSLVGSNLTITGTATFRTNFSAANFRLAVVLIEDNVTGTTSGYNQVNYYSGGTTPMGGYENLPNPVPAAQMVYDHVGRILLGGYNGQVGSVPSVITDGQAASYTFNTVIPTTYNTANMKAVLLLIDANNGKVINARSFVLGTLGTTEIETNKNYFTIYPNPTSDYIKIQSDYNVDLNIFDASGKLVMTLENVTPDRSISVRDLSSGIYLVVLKDKKGQSKTQKLIKK